MKISLGNPLVKNHIICCIPNIRPETGFKGVYSCDNIVKEALLPLFLFAQVN
jgi:hypothetical protein